MLLRIQGKNRHIERIKEGSRKKDSKKQKNELEELKEKLKELVEKEKFEEAAVIRDEIKKIEI